MLNIDLYKDSVIKYMFKLERVKINLNRGKNTICKYMSDILFQTVPRKFLVS